MPLATRNFALIVTLFAVAVSHVQPSTVIFCPLQVDSVELSRASFAEIKLAVQLVSGTAVTLNGCMLPLQLSSYNRRGGVMEVFLVLPLIVL